MVRRPTRSRAKSNGATPGDPQAVEGGKTSTSPRRLLGSRQPNSPHRLNLKFLRRTIRLAAPYWRSTEKRKAWWLLAALLLLLVGYTELAVLFNQQSGEVTSALAA